MFITRMFIPSSRPRACQGRRSRRSSISDLRLSVACLLEDRTLLATAIGVNFSGGSGNNFAPPDTDGSVGPNNYVQFINGRFAVYNKATGASILAETDTAFWNNAGISTTLTNPGLSDTRVYYDALSDRWFATEITTPSTGNQVLVGRSDTNNPAGTWKAVNYTGDAGFADYPTLGVDANAVLVGTNNFSSFGSFTSVTMTTIPKADLLLSTPTAANRTTLSQTSVALGFTPQGVTNEAPSPTHSSVVAINNSNSSRINDTQVTGTGAAGATFGSTTVISAAAYSAPGDARQPDGTRTNDGDDQRIAPLTYQVGDLIFIVRGISVNSSGVAATSSSTTTDAARVTVIRDSTKALVTEATYFNPSFDYTYPSIAVNNSGDIILGFTRSSGTQGSGATNGNLGAYAVYGKIDLNNPSAGITFSGGDIQLKAGNANNYHLFSGTGDRWGDFSQTAIDPSNQTSFWTTQEFANSGGTGTASSWGTQISQIYVSPQTTGVTSPLANGTYGYGTTVPITVSFDDAVVVTGNPTLMLNTTGGEPGVATYVSGSGTNTLTFEYFPGIGQSSAKLDYASTAALTLPVGASIKDMASSLDAILTLPAPGATGSLGAGKSIAIVTPVLPTVTTGSATSVTATSATLQGTVNPNGSTTMPRFQFSTTPLFTPTFQTTYATGFNDPYGVAVDALGDVFVSDALGNSVKEVKPDGTIIPIGSGFIYPQGIAVDRSGDVFVADYGNHDVKEVLPDGNILILASLDSAGLVGPAGLAVDGSGDVFVSDETRSLILEILPNGNILTLADSGLFNPYGLAVDAAGDVFVADTNNNAVREILPGGTIVTLGSGFNQPIGIAVDGSGDVFVADYNNSLVKELLPDGTILTLGSGFNQPTGVALDGAGDLFVTDQVLQKLFELSPPTIAATPSPLNGSTAQAISASASGLNLGTTYYYRAVGSNAAGSAVGQTASFTTQSTLQVTSFAPTTTGFTATFDEPFNLTPLHLYTTAAANLGPADVSVVGASTGPVQGSLIVNATDTGFTFVKTGGVLAPDTYTVTFLSSANGFQTPSASLLDGNYSGTPGTNYTTTFTVAPGTAVVVAIPDFARGPGQPVVIPADVGTLPPSPPRGLPLTISDGTNVTSITLTLTYNPSLLTITGANPGLGAPGAMVSVDTTTPGIAILTLTSSTALPAGLDTFATLVASVPNGAPYGSKEDLVISNISVNSGAIPAVDQDGVHVVAYLGDTTGNGGYSGLDASLIARVVANIDSGFAAFPLADPTILGDIAGRGSLSAQDASFVAQFVANIPQPRIPALPNITITKGGPDPLIWLPQNIDAAPGSTLAVPVLFRQTNGSSIGLDSADIAIEFDPSIFIVTGVSPGDVTQGFTLTESYNNATGALIASARSTSGPIALAPGTQGALLWVELMVRPGASLGAARLNLLGEGRVGNTVLYTALNGGDLTLVPAPTDSDTDPTDGIVTVTQSPTTSPTASPTSPAVATTPGAAVPPQATPGNSTVTAPAVVSTTTTAAVIAASSITAAPPEAIDLALEVLGAEKALVTLDDSQSGEPIATGLIPWTPSDPSTGSPTSIDLQSPTARKKAGNGKVILSQTT